MLSKTLAVALAVALLGAAARADESASSDRAQQLALGKYLSADCVTCHKLSQKDRRLGQLFGLSPDEIETKLATLLDTEEKATHMGWILSDLTAEETRALAVYLASLPHAEQ